MEAQIFGLMPFKTKYHRVEIFGYSTRGVPGLEITGLGAQARGMTQKFVFLSRARHLKVPFKRYQICVEAPLQSGIDVKEALTWLELPLLLLYWQLAEVISIFNLDQCLCSGRVHVSGNYELLRVPKPKLESILTEQNRQLSYIGDSELLSNIKILDTSQILAGVPGMTRVQENP